MSVRASSSSLHLFTVALACVALVACGDDDRPSSDTGGGGMDVGDTNTTGDTNGTDTTVVRPDTGVFDPFDPVNGCGSSTIETERVPGNLLIVFDRSGSMDGEVGGSTKWALATSGINNVLSSVPDELSASLMLFSRGGDCSVDSTPDVPMAPLPTSRGAIASALGSSSPGGSTPAFDALLAGYDYLNTLTVPGPQGVVLVSDGGESCSFERRAEVMRRVEDERVLRNRLTFAVGLNFADNNMSEIAFRGGTPRNDTCAAMCTSGSCLTDADCGGSTCAKFIESEPGFCSCETDGECIGAQTCEAPPVTFGCDFFPALCAKRCEGPADCCHYNAGAGDFRAEFEDALGEIAGRLLDSCVFEVPEGEMFDPSLVNVGVTFDGESRSVLRRSSDSSMDSWNYTTPENESIIIQGPICERLLAGESGRVEIVLGCSTLI